MMGFNHVQKQRISSRHLGGGTFATSQPAVPWDRVDASCRTPLQTLRCDTGGKSGRFDTAADGWYVNYCSRKTIFISNSVVCQTKVPDVPELSPAEWKQSRNNYFCWSFLPKNKNHLCSPPINVTPAATNPGVISDSDLSFEKQVSKAVQSCLYRLRSITKIRSDLEKSHSHLYIILAGLLLFTLFEAFKAKNQLLS